MSRIVASPLGKTVAGSLCLALLDPLAGATLLARSNKIGSRGEAIAEASAPVRTIGVPASALCDYLTEHGGWQSAARIKLVAGPRFAGILAGSSDDLRGLVLDMAREQLLPGESSRAGISSHRAESSRPTWPAVVESPEAESRGGDSWHAARMPRARFFRLDEIQSLEYLQPHPGRTEDIVPAFLAIGNWLWMLSSELFHLRAGSMLSQGVGLGLLAGAGLGGRQLEKARARRAWILMRIRLQHPAPHPNSR